jgi:hypothetical protein
MKVIKINIKKDYPASDPLRLIMTYTPLFMDSVPAMINLR